MEHERLRELMGTLISESTAFKRSVSAVSLNLEGTRNIELAKETLTFHLERFKTFLSICQSEL